MTERLWMRGGIERVTIDEGGRFYIVDGNRLWSVTYILSRVLPKKALDLWKRKMGGIAPIHYHDKITTLLDGETVTWDPKTGRPTSPGAKAVYELVTNYSDAAAAQAAVRGTLLHDYAEAHVLGAPMPPIPDEITDHMTHFAEFLDVWSPEFIAVESPVYSPSQLYAGTLDIIADFDRSLFTDRDLEALLGPCLSVEAQPAYQEQLEALKAKPTLRLLGDYKTGKRPYADAALQMAAYRWADGYYALPDSSGEPIPEVDGAIVIQITADGYAVYPVWTGEHIFGVFTYLREVFRWEEETWKHALGRPVTNPTQPRLVSVPEKEAIDG